MARAALTAALLAGCPFDSPVDPLVVGGGGRGGGGGGGGNGGLGQSLVGSWRHLAATTVSVTDSRWSFTAGGACVYQVIKTLLDTGSEETTVRACSYALAGSTLTVVFNGSTFINTFSVSLSGGDLLLNGFRFRRIT